MFTHDEHGAKKATFLLKVSPVPAFFWLHRPDLGVPETSSLHTAVTLGKRLLLYLITLVRSRGTPVAKLINGVR